MVVEETNSKKENDLDKYFLNSFKIHFIFPVRFFDFQNTYLIFQMETFVELFFSAIDESSMPFGRLTISFLIIE